MQHAPKMMRKYQVSQPILLSLPC